MTSARSGLLAGESEKKPTSGFWTKISTAISFARTLADQAFFIGSSIDLLFGLAPEILTLSPWGVGVGCGSALLLALAEAHCHNTVNTVNENDDVPQIPAEADIKIPLKYKLMLVGHVLADIFDIAGATTVLWQTFRAGKDKLSLFESILSKALGAALGAAYSVAETRTAYQSYRKLMFFKDPQLPVRVEEESIPNVVEDDFFQPYKEAIML